MAARQANTIRRSLFLCLLCLISFVVIHNSGSAQSARTKTGTSSDTTSDTTVDTTRRVVPDTMAYILLEQMQLEAERKRDTIIHALNFNELAVAQLFSQNVNLRPNIDNAFYHDAGDFFTSERGFFTVDYLPTPMRHTVTPYGLNSTNVTPLFDGRPLALLEHLPEQDGLHDYNEVPTAPVTDVYALHGPLSAFFGADNGVAGVYLKKVKPAGYTPESRLEAQKGTFSYAYTKGIIAERTASGFSYLAALGYRKVNYQLVGGRDDDMYHQYWEFSVPLAQKTQVTSSVRLYRRQGDYMYQPQFVAEDFTRHRRDRDITAKLEQSPGKNRTLALEFRHQRNESSLKEEFFSDDYKVDRRQNSITVSHTARTGTFLYTSSASVLRSYFDIADFSYQRDEQSASLRGILANNTDSADASRLFFGELGLKTITKYRSKARFNLGFHLRGHRSELTLSAGMTPVFPSQYERFLPDEVLFAGGGSADLRQSGTSYLVAENQYTAALALTHRISSLKLQANAVVGKVNDGIRWIRSTTMTTGTFIQPLNEDYDFAALSLRAELPLSAGLLWSGAAGFYNVDYENTPAPTYTPQYNLQTALTFNHYIQRLELYLSGHGELSLPGPYLANDGSQLGRDPVINARLSFRIKRFNFHYMFEDLNSISYAQREQYQHLGRYNWYWVTWDFLD